MVTWLCRPNYVFEFAYIFDTVLYQFVETGTSERTLMGLDQFLKCLGFSLNPLSFFLYSPCKVKTFVSNSANHQLSTRKFLNLL